MLENQSVLTENLPVADGVAKLCQAGQDALTYLEGNNSAPVGWKQKASTSIEPVVNKRIGDLLIQIASGVQKLVEAVPGK